MLSSQDWPQELNWTGLDSGLDRTGLDRNSLINTAVYRANAIMAITGILSPALLQ